VNAIKSLTPADGTAEILAPGELLRRTRAERAATGIPLGPMASRELTEVATALDVPPPLPDPDRGLMPDAGRRASFGWQRRLELHSARLVSGQRHPAVQGQRVAEVAEAGRR
jgi:hypothetical protein